MILMLQLERYENNIID